MTSNLNMLPSEGMTTIPSIGTVPTKKLISKSEMARKLDKSRAWVEQLIEKGDIIEVEFGQDAKLVCNKEDVIYSR